MSNIIEIFPWNENFETGLSVVDEQHKKLVQLINTLASHLAYGSDMPTLSSVFNELTDYAAHHFQTEETIWHQYFPDDNWEAAHKKIHSSFVSNVRSLKLEESTKPMNQVVEDILSMLTHWLALHILDEDMRAAKVVLAVQSGLPLEQAKDRASRDVTGAMQVLIETVLSMYDNLSSRTLQLMKEINEHQKAEAKLRLAANVFDNTLEAICITDADANIIDANPAFCRTTGYTRDEVVGANLRTLKSGLIDEKQSSAIWPALAEQGHWSGEIQSHSKKGEFMQEWLTLSSIKNELGSLTNYVGVFSNIELLFQQQHQLKYTAYHDALTGLPNRLLLEDRLDQAITQAERSHSLFAVCYLDLDKFKPVNDKYGHAAGDELLREIARRLKDTMRANDTVARMGGDEFVILIGGLKQPEDCEGMLDRILQEVERPLNMQGNEVRVTASMGVAFFQKDGKQPEELLQFADKAMYQVKDSDTPRYKFHTAANC
jgi:diguanylate cyclase (GGDEF)-like protein/hemerythrin-like metal-binding protein/PAS domain S-box-containing protein